MRTAGALLLPRMHRSNVRLSYRNFCRQFHGQQYGEGCLFIFDWCDVGVTYPMTDDIRVNKAYGHDNGC